MTNTLLYHDIINCLVGALDAKDIYTAGHAERVGDMSYDLAEKYGVQGKALEFIHIAGHLHDIGKIGISDRILLKKKRLNEEEFRIIKTHPEVGRKILDNSSLLKDVSNIVLHHHERFDGLGYPHGLKGDEIPLGSRVIAICDSIDAMISNRVYRNAFSWEHCKQEIITNAGKMYDPELVDVIDDQLWNKWERYYLDRNDVELLEKT